MTTDAGRLHAISLEMMEIQKELERSGLSENDTLHTRADELVQEALVLLGAKALSDAYADCSAHFWYS